MTTEPTEPTDTYISPEHGWTCFHCGETFMHQNAAREHFGAHPFDAEPGCMLRMQHGEGSLLRKIRWLEREVRRLTFIIDTGGSDAEKAMHSMVCEHAQALLREEEKGYAKGLADGMEMERPYKWR